MLGRSREKSKDEHIHLSDAVYLFIYLCMYVCVCTVPVCHVCNICQSCLVQVGCFDLHIMYVCRTSRCTRPPWPALPPLPFTGQLLPYSYRKGLSSFPRRAACCMQFPCSPQVSWSSTFSQVQKIPRAARWGFLRELWGIEE